MKLGARALALGVVLIASQAAGGALGGPKVTAWSSASTVDIVFEGSTHASAFIEARCREDGGGPSTSCCVKRFTDESGQLTRVQSVSTSTCVCDDFDKALNPHCSARTEPIVVSCSASIGTDFTHPIAQASGGATCALDWNQSRTASVQLAIVYMANGNIGAPAVERVRTN